MWNIIKSQNYQIKGDTSVIVGFIVCLCLPILAQISNESGMDDFTGSVFMINDITFIPMIFFLFSLFVVTKACGWDMNDKTMNYELLSGHSRAEVYFGRVVTALAWGIIGGIVVTLGPILVVTAVNGWGDNLVFRDAMFRYFLILVVYLRWISELILLTFIVRNYLASAFLGLGMFEAGMICGFLVKEFFNLNSIDNLFAGIDMLLLGEFGNSRNVIINGKSVQLFEATVSNATRNNTILVSLIVSIVCIISGYVVFRKRDLS